VIMKKIRHAAVQSVIYPTNADYTPRFVEITGQPRREYYIPGAPLEAALILGSVTKEDLVSINPGLKRAIKKYNPSNGGNIGFIGLAQHYLFWALRGTGVGLSVLYDGKTLTDDGQAYMRAMEFDPDRLPELSDSDRKKLKDDLARAVDGAFKLLKQKQQPSDSG